MWNSLLYWLQHDAGKHWIEQYRIDLWLSVERQSSLEQIEESSKTVLLEMKQKDNNQLLVVNDDIKHLIV